MNNLIKTQVVVIGSGPSGYSSAFRCADLGLKTILIERYKKLGGVCLNVGCIPSKYLLYISKIIEEIKILINKNIILCNFKKNINKIREYKNNIINKINTGILNLSKFRKIKIINGIAKFKNINSLIIENNLKKIELIFNFAIIATGSRPIKLPFLKEKSSVIWNSNDALQLTEIPKKLLIIGGGIIGLEMSYIYNSLGSEVDIIEINNQIIPEADIDISRILYKIMKKKINIMLNTFINKIKIRNNFAYVEIKHKNFLENKIYNKILVAIGRKPNINNINIKKIGIKINNKGFILTDNQLRTNINNIFAIGDITGQPMLAHKGIYEGHIAANVIFGNNYSIFEKKNIPSIAYTDPELAWVGVTEKIAIKNNINYKISIFPWSASGRAIILECEKGVTKLIFENKTNKIIGGAIVGTHGGELLGEICLAIEMCCDVEDIALTIHAHPTLNESIKLAAELYLGVITDIIPKK
ncbi:MAG: dihydrolipoyl dehydrogenase [Enterobacteriaceae bacterium PSpicST2]|nr:MAG: dihydrolipoyl dehydrogenase [Enterobacteriaceae bacterium PSpicST2]WMC19061.1 MAG: dihydrolipoyl dehydrogenase [Enterobacteriaceae bacterium PSpicST1]